MRAASCCAGVLISVAALVTSDIADACAGCRNPSLPVTRGSEGALPADSLRLGAALTGTTIHVTHEAGCRDAANCRELPVQPAHLHDQRLYPVELRVSGEYGFTTNLGIELQFPFRLVYTTVEYTTLDGEPYNPIDRDVHHRNETIAGPSDPWLLGRVGTTIDGYWIALRAGVSVPIGRNEENPFELGDRGLKHQHIQLGSGTFDPVAVAEASTELGKLRLNAFTQAVVPLYENSHGYRSPWRVYGGTGVGTELVRNTDGSVGLEAFHEAAERWSGQVRQDASLGRTEVLAMLSLTQEVRSTQFTLAVRIPFYRHIVVGDEPPGTLHSPITLTLNVTHVAAVLGEDRRTGS